MVTCPSPKITAGLLSQRNGSRATGQLGCLAFGKDNARGRLENGSRVLVVELGGDDIDATEPWHSHQ